MFSRRTAFDRTPNSLALALANRGEKPLLDLTRTNPTLANLPYSGAAIAAGLADLSCLAYRPDPFGLLSARTALASRLPLSPPPSHVFLTASTSEAYGLLFKLLCDPGDAVLVPRPSYPLFEHLAALENVRLVPYGLAYDGAWHVDRASLARSDHAGAKAVVVVSPNNPTGSFLKKDELAAIARLGLPIISDEVFAEYSFGQDPGRVATAREQRDVLTFTMGGLSKSSALPQMKLAWTCITGPEADVQEAHERLEILGDAYLSPSAPVQVALPTLLEAGDATRAALLARLIRNRDEASRMLGSEASPATLLHVEGGWTACLRLPNTRSEDEWLFALLEAGVLVQPGSFYDFDDEPFVIVSLLTPEDDFRRGLAILCATLTR